MDKPYIVEALQKKVEVKSPFVVGTFDFLEEVVAQTHETNEKEFLPTSVVAYGVNIGIHLNRILDNNLNSSNSTLVTKSPTQTPPQSPNPLSKHTLSREHGLSMVHVTSYPQ